jgi:hypothetical protein
MMRRFQTSVSNSTFAATPSHLDIPEHFRVETSWQGLTLVHFSAQPEPVSITEAIGSILCSAQLNLGRFRR